MNRTFTCYMEYYDHYNHEQKPLQARRGQDQRKLRRDKPSSEESSKLNKIRQQNKHRSSENRCIDLLLRNYQRDPPKTINMSSCLHLKSNNSRGKREL
ncbi:hypothetical protein KSP39_PZI003066 [Platanthera zijinensis]|uniref:Uncharacterized protein n=1 Tax=Platanthera zijinensis TaxID=2320716 RepID=A0AAP0BWL3_9ASPA